MGAQTQEQITLLTDYDANSSYNQAYQTLFTNIRLSWDKASKQHQSVILVAPEAHTGRADAPTNVAIAAAQSGTPTILVDADMEHPSLHQRFGLGEQAGLSNLLNEEGANPQHYLSHLHKTLIPDLTLLCAGPALSSPERTRLLTQKGNSIRENLQQILQAAEQRRGLIIFHSPPVLTSTDAAILSTCVDQTFLVIMGGHTTRAQARQAQHQMERAHVTITGIVMLDA